MPASTVAERIEEVRARINAACLRGGRSAEDITLIAVTKGFAAEAIREACEAGIKHFGENRVQEAQEKAPALADLRDVTRHMIGHLQTNKVKTAVTLFDIIHSVDSLHLAEEISRRAPQTVPAFLETNISGESSKFGMSLKEIGERYESIAALPNIDVRGLMTVAPLAADREQTRAVFRQLRETADALGLRELSMGMTGDFETAIEEGATHIRVGRAIFGERI
jgi:pyridoxal phosphate enzyme (YggS family)